MAGQSEPSNENQLNYLDFEVEVRAGRGQEYQVAVLNSPAGQTQAVMHFPYTESELDAHLKTLELALLRGTKQGLRGSFSVDAAVREFGKKLFDSLLIGEIHSLYRQSRATASHENKGLRLKLRIQPAELANLPWEFMYDASAKQYVCLSSRTPVVRYLDLPHTLRPATTTLPLRILGLVASPDDLEPLDVESEKRRINASLAGLQARGLVELVWLEGDQTWRTLQRVIRQGVWHVFHYIGHGRFDTEQDLGYLGLRDEGGGVYWLKASQLSMLLRDDSSLRLAVLNSCEGARADRQDAFSSTAATLVTQGVPAVLAMQYPITDQAALEFSRSFYEALADGFPIDGAVAEARKTMEIALTNTIEWGTPVLYMRTPDGVLFNVAGQQIRLANERIAAEKEARQKAIEESAARERADRERLALERSEAERRAARKAEAERLAREQANLERPANDDPSGRLGMKLGGRYTIEALLGQGGMSAVYRAIDPNLHRPVAAKLIHPHLSDNPEFIRRFELEAAAVAQLRHPHIIQVHDYDHDGSLYYMILEYIRGETLQTRMKKLREAGQQLSLTEVVRILTLMCDAVDYAHQRGMVHRDIKPGNVMLDESNQPILTDFGLAKIMGGQALTASDALLGTVAYMSPEQLQNTGVDSRSDIYSLGIMLYEMTAGHPPFEGDSVGAIVLKHIQSPPPDVRQANADIPASLSAVIEKALAKTPAARFQTAAELAAALRAVPLQPEAIRERVLDAAIAQQVPVDKAMLLLAQVRLVKSPGLRGVLESETDLPLVPDNVRSSPTPFPVSFPTDARGVSHAASLSLHVVAPDFEPPSQWKTVSIPPDQDSAVHTFELVPHRAGDLLVTLEVYWDKTCLVSRPLKTTGLSQAAPLPAGSYLLTSLALTINAQGDVNIGGDVVAHDKVVTTRGAYPTTGSVEEVVKRPELSGSDIKPAAPAVGVRLSRMTGWSGASWLVVIGVLIAGVLAMRGFIFALGPTPEPTATATVLPTPVIKVTHQPTEAPTPTATTRPTPTITNSPPPTVLPTPDFDQIEALRVPQQGGLPVLSVAWSPDGRWLATGDNNRTVRLFDTATWGSPKLVGEESQAQPAKVRGLAWSGDSRWLAWGNGVGQVWLWDTQAATGPQLREKGHFYPVWSVAWSPRPDSDRFASASEDGVVFIWDTGSVTPLYKITQVTGPVRSLAWSPDGAQLALGRANGGVEIWELSTLQLIQTLPTTKAVWAVAWSSSTGQLAAGLDDGKVLIWDGATWNVNQTLADAFNNKPALSIAWWQNQTYLAVGHYDGTIQIWETTHGDHWTTPAKAAGSIWSVSWSPNLPRLAAASVDSTVGIWGVP